MMFSTIYFTILIKLNLEIILKTYSFTVLVLRFNRILILFVSQNFLRIFNNIKTTVLRDTVVKLQESPFSNVL